MAVSYIYVARDGLKGVITVVEVGGGEAWGCPESADELGSGKRVAKKSRIIALWAEMLSSNPIFSMDHIISATIG